MKKDASGKLVFSPSDLVRYLDFPFVSWMDRYSLENPGAVTPDEETEDERLFAQTDEQQEQTMLETFTPIPKVVSKQADLFVYEHIF